MMDIYHSRYPPCPHVGVAGGFLIRIPAAVPVSGSRRCEALRFLAFGSERHKTAIPSRREGSRHFDVRKPFAFGWD
ncbi:MAG: hypothetical protein OHK0044_09670 [Burkholderiaceae bacterium]